NGQAAEHMAIARKKPANARKPTASMDVGRSLDGAMAHGATERNDGSPLRKPCARPVLVRHAPRASPRPWCLKNGALPSRYATAMLSADRFRAATQATPASHSFHGANSNQLRRLALGFAFWKPACDTGLVRGGLPQFTPTRRQVRMPLRKRRKEGICQANSGPASKRLHLRFPATAVERFHLPILPDTSSFS